MANEQSGEKKGLFGRGLEFFKKLHYGIGALAVGAAVVLESSFLAGFGVLELAHGFILGEIEKWSQNRKAKSRSIGRLALAA